MFLRGSVFLLAGLCLAGCGSNQALLAQRNQSEAEYLQAYCRKAGVAGAEARKADSLLVMAQNHMREGDAEPALAAAERARILYRLALVRREFMNQQVQVDSLKTALAKDQDQLRTYQDVLQEMKARSKP